MNPESPKKTWQGKSAADLMARSKNKFALARARMSQRHIELALLSLQGSLEDTLRGHLLLRGNPAAAVEWETLLAALQDDEEQHPLSREEAERLRRFHLLCSRIASGEAVTVPPERAIAYQTFFATLMARYGVLVVTSETDTASNQANLDMPFAGEESTEPEPEPQPADTADNVPSLFRHYRTHLLPAAIIVFLFLIGSTITIAWQQLRPERQGTLFAATYTPSPPPLTPLATTATVVPSLPPTQATIVISRTNPITVPASPTFLPTPPHPTTLTIGHTAYVQSDVAEGLALRAEPGTSASIPVQLYLNANTAVLIVDGPVQRDGYTWWKVRAANKEGWCAGAFLEMR